MKMAVKNNQWLVAIFVITTFVLTVATWPAVVTDPVPEYFSAWIFYGIFVVGQNAFFSLSTVVVLAIIFRCCRSARLKLALAFLPYAAVLMFFIASAKVFSIWHLYLNQAVFQLFFSKGGGTNVFEVTPLVVFYIILSIILGFLFALILLKLAYQLAGQKWMIVLGGVFCAVYFFSQVTYGIFLRQSNVSQLQFVTKVPYFSQLSPVTLIAKLGIKIAPSNKLFSDLYEALHHHSRVDYPIHSLSFPAKKQKENVLLIVLDTLRFDSIKKQYMPNLTRFSQQADQFKDNWSGGDCTRAGIFSLFYSIPITYWQNVLVHQQGSLLIDAFKQAGYHFGVFASAGLMSPPWYKTVFLNLHHYPLLTIGDTPQARDIKITKETNHFLHEMARSKQPFFDFTFFDLVHAYNAYTVNKPFSPAKSLNYFTVSNHTNPAPIKNRYHNAVFFDDHLLASIFSVLKKTGLDKNTVVIVTSDHGQEFNEYHNNYWEHASGFSKYQIRTPLIIKWPGKKPEIIKYQTSHFDLVPTLFKHILGVKNPVSDYSVGYDFYNPYQSNFVIAGHYGQYALVTNGLVMPFHKSGLYRFADNTMQPINMAHLPGPMKRKLLKQLWQYY